MRLALVLLLAIVSVRAHAQAGWMPLSREVEQPYATALQRHGSDAHTAIRPYARKDILNLQGLDSLRPAAVVKALDRWAGTMDDRAFRWGPLMDASIGHDVARADRRPMRYGAGLWADVDASKRLSFHFDAQAWRQQLPRYLDTLVNATQVMPGEGYAYGDAHLREHYDWNAHVSWDLPKYFNFTLGRGRNSFGEGYRSLMLSDEAYSYPFFRITTSVWKIKYVNLYTRMNDIRGAAGDPSGYRAKYSAMHYLSWNISKRFNLALFEAIVWQGGDSIYPRGFDMNYLNPIIFYRPVEFDIGSPDNALLGAALNVKVGRNTLLYSQVVLDEMVIKEVRSGEGWYANKQSLQLGVVAREAFAVRGLALRGEWNFVRPFMYTHSDTRQNYAHFAQPLAHPYGSNFQEALVHGDLLRGPWSVGLRMSMAWLGSDDSLSYGNNIFRPESDRPRQPNGLPENYGYRVGMRNLVDVFHGELRAGYLLDPHSATRLEVSYLFRQRTPDGAANSVDHYFRLGLVCNFRQRYTEQEVRYVIP